MRLFALALVGFGCLITLSGCSSPFLPHNAVKYIPEFSHAETTKNIYPSEDLEETEQGENAMREETIDLHSSYFSPKSIKERYARHIEDCEKNDSEPLLDIVYETIDLMRQARKSDNEICNKLTEKFGLTEEEAQLLLEQASEENSL